MAVGRAPRPTRNLGGRQCPGFWCLPLRRPSRRSLPPAVMGWDGLRQRGGHLGLWAAHWTLHGPFCLSPSLPTPLLSTSPKEPKNYPKTLARVPQTPKGGGPDRGVPRRANPAQQWQPIAAARPGLRPDPNRGTEGQKEVHPEPPCKE